MKHPFRSILAVSLGAATIALVAPAHAETAGFYIGIDTRNPLASGVYRNLPNPNFNRLTFLYAHTYEYVPGLAPAGASTFAINHYHPIGAYSYSGPSNAPVTQVTSSNNRIPEIATAQPPLTLIPATNGLFAGKLVNARTEEHFSDMRWWATDDLNQPTRYGPGSPEWILFYSSAGTRTNSVSGAVVHLELVSKTTGLHVGATNALDIVTNPGDRYNLGAGEAIRFTPVFWVDGNAAVGTYSATFKLIDVNTDGGRTPFGESGLFTLDFKVAPEPQMTIAPAVNLNLPIVTAGYVLEGAVSTEGPWTPVTLPHGTHSGDRQTVALPATGNLRVFRLRKL